MLNLNIPGGQALQLTHLVLDFNGTLALDGRLLPDIRPRLSALSDALSIHVLTGDIHGTAGQQLADIPCTLEILPTERQMEAKLKYIQSLDQRQVVAIGNGRNDQGMLAEAAVGIALIEAEGAAVTTLCSADLVCRHIGDALDLLIHPLRLIASLRS